ncbi:hypothetical protein ACFQX7_17415 [Luedemannella flava]
MSDQLAAGLMAAILVAAVPTVAVPVVALRILRRRPVRAGGLLVGWVLGTVVIAQLFGVVTPLLNELPATCPCEPAIEQLGSWGG